MNVENLFSLFEKNGGIAKNITVDSNEYGRGIFVLNKFKRIEIFLPSHLLIESSKIIFSKNLELKLSKNLNLNSSVKEFYDFYFKYFGFNNEIKLSISNFYNQLNELSFKLKEALSFNFESYVFNTKLNDNELLKIYLNSRQINFKEKPHFMPIIELINHSNNGANYNFSNGISVKGNFEEEVFANYNNEIDSFDFFQNYKFYSKQKIALSCKLKINYKNKQISVERKNREYEIINGIKVPIVSYLNNTITFSQINITNSIKKKQYREFLINKLVKFSLSISQVNEFFDGLIVHNLSILNNIIKECEKNKSFFSSQIIKIAKNQISSINN